MWFIGVEVEQETSAPPPKKNPGSAPGCWLTYGLTPQSTLYVAGQCLVVTLLTNNKEREQKIDEKKKEWEGEKKETVMGSLIGWFAAFNVSLIIDSSFLFSQRI